MAATFSVNKTICNVNIMGAYRVVNNFLPFLQAEGGRIVNISSASGPVCVSKASDDMKKFYLNDKITWKEIQGKIDEVKKMEKEEEFTKSGFGDGLY
eukprot:UN28871